MTAMLIFLSATFPHLKKLMHIRKPRKYASLGFADDEVDYDVI